VDGEREEGSGAGFSHFARVPLSNFSISWTTGVGAPSAVAPAHLSSACCAVQARKMEQKRLWCQAIKKLIIDNFHKRIPDRAKQVVLDCGDNDKGWLRASTWLTCYLQF